MLKKIIVPLGPTQAGKSSFVRSLQPYDTTDLPAVGRPGAGRSVTEACQIYHTKAGYDVIDTPGNNDTDRDVKIEEFTNQIASLVLDQHDTTGVRFLIVDSLANDSSRLRDTVQVLESAFGKKSKTSAVVLATKKDKLDDDELEERMHSMEELLDGLGMSNCPIVLWKSRKVAEDEMRKQMDVLGRALDATIPTRLPKPEISRGDHVIIADSKLHAIVLRASYDGVEEEWKITVATFIKEDDRSKVQFSSVTSTQIKDNKVSVGGELKPDELERAACRAEFLKEHPEEAKHAPPHCASECFATWCRAGEWKPCSISGMVSAANPTLVLKGGAVSAVAAGAGVEVSAGGIAGFLGGTVWTPLGPILVPVIMAGTAICSYNEYTINKKMWAEYGKTLNQLFSSISTRTQGA